MKYIETLKEGMHIADIYLCKTKQIALTKSGKEYGNLILQDKTGTVDAKIWDLGSPGINEFESMDYIFVEADVTVFMGTNQLNVKRVRKASEGEYIPADYLPVSQKDIKKMYGELKGIIESIKNPYLNQLAKSFFFDERFEKVFSFHSAAKSVHHGFVGGLLEHTLSVVNMCLYFAKSYPMINKDLLITAAMFHDVGKIKELSTFPENDYTDDGQLLGHIVIGTQMLHDAMKKIPDFPDRLAAELKHCIISHHGELEYGSPKKPAILEAVALNFADNADAKMQTMIEVLQNAGTNQGWLGYNRLLETNIRKSYQE